MLLSLLLVHFDSLTFATPFHSLTSETLTVLFSSGGGLVGLVSPLVVRGLLVLFSLLR